jgi:hypothetical protein
MSFQISDILIDESLNESFNLASNINNTIGPVINKNLIPTVPNIYNLGSPTHRYKDLATNILTVGNVTLSASGNNLIVGDFTVKPQLLKETLPTEKDTILDTVSDPIVNASLNVSKGNMVIGKAVMSVDAGQNLQLPSGTTINGQNPGTITILGTYTDSTQLPSGGNIGDAYTITDNLWICTDSTQTPPNNFTNIGTFQGPLGPTGPIGQQGTNANLPTPEQGTFGSYPISDGNGNWILQGTNTTNSSSNIILGTYALRNYTATTYNSIAIGSNAAGGNASSNVSAFSISIGSQAGYDYHSMNTIAIGYKAGYFNQGLSAIAIGSSAGQTNQQQSAIAIGLSAGSANQEQNAISIGTYSGCYNQQSNSIAIGLNAAEYNQQQYSVAIGSAASLYGQKPNSIAIGEVMTNQGGQGQNSIAIGNTLSGQVDNNILFGNSIYSYFPNCIAFNATQTQVNILSNSGFFANPIRVEHNPLSGNVTPLYYNTLTSEIQAYIEGESNETNFGIGAISILQITLPNIQLSGSNSITSTLAPTNPLWNGSIKSSNSYSTPAIISFTVSSPPRISAPSGSFNGVIGFSSNPNNLNNNGLNSGYFDAAFLITGNSFQVISFNTSDNSINITPNSYNGSITIFTIIFDGTNFNYLISNPDTNNIDQLITTQVYSSNYLSNGQQSTYPIVLPLNYYFVASIQTGGSSASMTVQNIIFNIYIPLPILPILSGNNQSSNNSGWTLTNATNTGINNVYQLNATGSLLSVNAFGPSGGVNQSFIFSFLAFSTGQSSNGISCKLYYSGGVILELIFNNFTYTITYVDLKLISPLITFPYIVGDNIQIFYEMQNLSSIINIYIYQNQTIVFSSPIVSGSVKCQAQITNPAGNQNIYITNPLFYAYGPI